jgi:transcriptional regulator with XRE-family HTH domain
MSATLKQPLTYAQRLDSQRLSTNSAPVEQVDFVTPRKPCPPVDKPYVLSLPSFRRVLRYSLSLADLEPKQVCDQLGMDKATWSRIENGVQAFNPEQLGTLAGLTGNDAPLIWLAHSRGYELRPLKSELQEQLDAARDQLAESERQNTLMRELLSSRR